MVLQYEPRSDFLVIAAVVGIRRERERLEEIFCCIRAAFLSNKSGGSFGVLKKLGWGREEREEIS